MSNLSSVCSEFTAKAIKFATPHYEAFGKKHPNIKACADVPLALANFAYNHINTAERVCVATGILGIANYYIFNGFLPSKITVTLLGVAAACAYKSHLNLEEANNKAAKQEASQRQAASDEQPEQLSVELQPKRRKDRDSTHRTKAHSEQLPSSDKRAVSMQPTLDVLPEPTRHTQKTKEKPKAEPRERPVEKEPVVAAFPLAPLAGSSPAIPLVVVASPTPLSVQESEKEADREFIRAMEGFRKEVVQKKVTDFKTGKPRLYALAVQFKGLGYKQGNAPANVKDAFGYLTKIQDVLMKKAVIATIVDPIVKTEKEKSKEVEYAVTKQAAEDLLNEIRSNGMNPEREARYDSMIRAPHGSFAPDSVEVLQSIGALITVEQIAARSKSVATVSMATRQPSMQGALSRSVGHIPIAPSVVREKVDEKRKTSLRDETEAEFRATFDSLLSQPRTAPPQVEPTRASEDSPRPASPTPSENGIKDEDDGVGIGLDDPRDSEEVESKAKQNAEIEQMESDEAFGRALLAEDFDDLTPPVAAKPSKGFFGRIFGKH